jgi:hypothetical protein
VGVTSVVDLPVLGVGDGTDEGEDAVPEVPGLGVPELGVGVPEAVDAEDVGLAGVEPVGVAGGVLGECVAGRREEWPLIGPSTGLPTASWNTMMAATTMTKNPAAMPP